MIFLAQVYSQTACTQKMILSFTAEGLSVQPSLKNLAGPVFKQRSSLASTDYSFLNFRNATEVWQWRGSPRPRIPTGGSRESIPLPRKSFRRRRRTFPVQIPLQLISTWTIFFCFSHKLCFRAIKKSFQWSVSFSKKAAEDVLITKSEWTVSKIDFWASRQQFRALLQCFTECKVQYCEGSAILALNPSDWFTTGRQLLLIKRRSSWFQIGSITINQLLLLLRQASSLFP